MSSLKNSRRCPSRMVATALLLAVITTAAFLHNHPLAFFPMLRPHPCGKIVLVSAPRHGSTWFISSAEGCTAKDSVTFGGLNAKTELWVPHGGGLDNITVSDAVEYVKTKRSLKIMPISAQRKEDIKAFLRGIRDGVPVPVFVLRRDLRDCYTSLREAQETRRWTRNKVNVSKRAQRPFVEDGQFPSYRKKIENFFSDMTETMRDIGIVWDELDYEDVSMQRVIVGQQNRCYIKNCNYI